MGTHCCFFYDDNNSQLRVIVPYIRQGLDRGDRILYFYERSSDKLFTGLARCGIPIDKIEFVLNSEVSPFDFVDFLEVELIASQKNKFSGLRFLKEMSPALWVEENIDQLFGRWKNFFGLYQYNTDWFELPVLLSIAEKHDRVCQLHPLSGLIKGQFAEIRGKQILAKNIFNRRPEIGIKAAQERLDKLEHEWAYFDKIISRLDALQYKLTQGCESCCDGAGCFLVQKDAPSGGLVHKPSI